MALQFPTLNENPVASATEEARRNVEDYLRAMNISESLRSRLVAQAMDSLEEAGAEKIAMQRLFDNPRVREILHNPLRGTAVQPETDFTSMLPGPMEYESMTPHATRIAVCAGLFAAIFAAAAFLF